MSKRLKKKIQNKKFKIKENGLVSMVPTHRKSQSIVRNGSL